uniref:Peptidase_S8 domain-containing protein n=1 Tax=Macrostomum lignano TaxID=282301 RepID=A0A1I8IFK7_9PLAT
VIWAERQTPRRRVKRAAYNDPLWPKMWYINDLHEVDRKPSMNILAVWGQGVTGRGVVTAVLDDGIDLTHPDLVKNYDPQASYDVNGRDFDPSFRETGGNRNRHGTRCAGLIAASSNNSMCIPGVAFGAQIGAIRMLDGQVTDAVEATALAYRPQHVDVYSASWGPSDDGRTVEGPGYLVLKALRDGAERGRQGRGSIFVWASGNGGSAGDNCNTDGYANSIFTLTVGSVSEFGVSPWYSETCPCILAVTYSSGNPHRERSVATTDLHGSCTDAHTGTSASAPIAAGIIALALSVNPRLGWRDVQHLTVRAANPSPFLKSVDWRQNGAGRNASHRFGFGLFDAARMVALARRWALVGPQQRCRVGEDAVRDLAAVEENAKAEVRLVADCVNLRHLEHVQAVRHPPGELQIWLQSPAGTVSQLLTRRPRDQQ